MLPLSLPSSDLVWRATCDLMRQTTSPRVANDWLRARWTRPGVVDGAGRDQGVALLKARPRWLDVELYLHFHHDGCKDVPLLRELNLFIVGSCALCCCWYAMRQACLRAWHLSHTQHVYRCTAEYHTGTFGRKRSLQVDQPEEVSAFPTLCIALHLSKMETFDGANHREVRSSYSNVRRSGHSQLQGSPQRHF
jgi:hypothetical protein